MDYSKLDQPSILSFVFYPREDWTPPPTGATDHSVSVAEDVSIGCRLYPSAKTGPSILFFHGNGEVAYDYDGVAPFYSRLGINLFVADYRGYGRSTGAPSFASTVADAHVIFRYFRDALRASGYTGPLFVMGRSLGSIPAVELASTYSQELRGLIIESGFASAGRLLSYLNVVLQSPYVDEFENASLDRIRSIAMPVLIIHGEWDEIIPPDQAQVFYDNVGSKRKKLLIIPGAGHNDMLVLGMQQYFAAIKEFVFA
jgi:alpha-beta hydrolase superfamily lysophospholipase